MKTIDLCGSWEFFDEKGTKYIGTVPGCVHTDLFTADDMFYEKNSNNVTFVENQDWRYRKEFCVEELSANAELYFEGLDTYCDIYLNGQMVGSTNNMFIPHSFSVDGVLRQGDNLLEVQFHSPIKAVEGKELLSGAFTKERLHTRRMQCTYGWDWVDRFVTCGIYRPVSIRFHEGTELEYVYVYTENIDVYSAQIKVTEQFLYFGAETNIDRGAEVLTEILSPQGDQLLSNRTWCEDLQSVLYFDIADPQLWYPRPYGQQPLYTLRITVAGEVHEQKFGIRTIKILQIQDQDANTLETCRRLRNTQSGIEWDQNETFSCFIPIINGIRVFCSGANWVPCEPFPSAETNEKITHLLNMAVDANVNMIRVWGGGIFERQHFYDECDRLGILVTQDFLMACGKYPEYEEEFQEQLRKEAEFAAIYLRNHPSLVWWTGDNENAVAGSDACKAYKGRIAARKMIAPVLELLDYNRRFLFSSPYGGDRYASKTVGTTHNTQFLNVSLQYIQKEDLSDYKEYWMEYIARFVAEEPVMGAISQNSLQKFISKTQLDNKELWLHHTKTNPGLGLELLELFTDFAEKLMGKFRDWEDQYFKMRYLQYEWIRFTMNHARSNLWFQSGLIYWMWNDCWPAAMGWALCDYYGEAKAGYYGFRHFAQPVSVSLEKEDGRIAVYVSSIVPEKTACDLKIWMLELDTGAMTVLMEKAISMEANVYKEILQQMPSDRQLLIAEINADQSQPAQVHMRNWYKHGCPILKKTEALSWSVLGDAVCIYAKQYLHAVEIIGAEAVDEQYFSLLPGEERLIRCQPIVDQEALQVIAYTFA